MGLYGIYVDELARLTEYFRYCYKEDAQKNKATVKNRKVVFEKDCDLGDLLTL